MGTDRAFSRPGGGERGPSMAASDAFLPSDRWGRNLTSYTSDTKKREEVASVVSGGAMGCALLVGAALAYAYFFPTMGADLVDTASRLSDEMAGLRQENALLKAHLRRLAKAQEELLPHHKPSPNGVRREALTSMRRLLMDTESFLQDEPEQRASSAGVRPGSAQEAKLFPEGVDLHVAGRTLSDSAPQEEPPRQVEVRGHVEEVPEEAPAVAGVVGRTVGSLLAVGEGMITGVREMSYNTYQALVVGRKTTYRAQPHHRERDHTTPTLWRTKMAKRTAKQRAKIKQRRNPRKQQRFRKPRKRL